MSLVSVAPSHRRIKHLIAPTPLSVKEGAENTVSNRRVTEKSIFPRSSKIFSQKLLI